MALIAVQTIADDQTEVASKTQTMLDENSIDATSFKNIIFASFGASKFQITVMYDG